MAERTEQLSLAARERFRAMLPELLGAVRRRRRRRYLRAGGGVVIAAAAGLLLVAQLLDGSPGGSGARTGDGVPPGAVTQAAVCQVVRTDGAAIAAWRARAAVPDDWYVDDDGLQDFLRSAVRPDGLVRVRGRVLVASEALDPLPGPPPDPAASALE